MVWSRCGHLFCLVTKQRAWNSWKANSFHLLITIHGELVQSFLSRCRGLRWTWSFPRFWSQLPHCSKFAHVPSSQSSQGPSPSQVLYKIYWNILYYVYYYMQVCVCVPICVYTFTTFMCFLSQIHTFNTGGGFPKLRSPAISSHHYLDGWVLYWCWLCQYLDSQV